MLTAASVSAPGAAPLFRDAHPLEQRQREAARMRDKYPDRIPVIVEPAARQAPAIDKRKYLVPDSLTVGQFVFVVRKRLRLPPEQALFVFVQNVLPPTAALMSALYDERRDADGFLYVNYALENTFGAPCANARLFGGAQGSGAR